MSKIEVDAIDKQSGSTLTLGGSGTAVTLACGATQTGFGRSGSVNWQTTIKTGDFTAANGEGYFVDTTSGTITVTLPSSPAVGTIVAISDYANTFDTSAVTLGRNSSNIEGAASDLLVNTEGVAVTVVYADATKGWIVTATGNSSNAFTEKFVAATGGSESTSGNFKIHTFTGPGTFTVNCAGNPVGSNTVSYVVVAGGGGGTCGGCGGSGGGGAGGYRESRAASDTYTASPLNATSGPTYNLPVSATGYPITVGSGGTAGNPAPNVTRGGVSTFSTITSAGGGTSNQGAPPAPMAPGGSGGGGASLGSGTYEAGGTGNTPPVSPPQGNNGGTGLSSPPGGPTASYRGGGGGGAGAVGCNGAFPGTGGNGGNGVTSCITGSPVTRGGGGGGGSGYEPGGSPAGTKAPGGTGGGGEGSKGAGSNGTAGTANTGGGGGGGGYPVNTGSGNAGGSGIVIIRYKYQ